MASLLNMSGSALIGAKHDDGHEYVDLGLPSGLLWATCNIGANSPEEAGLYFAWGETTGYADAAARNAALGLTGGFDQTAYEATGTNLISADLTPQQDAAHAYLGGSWRMPSKTEYQELYNNCTSEWTTLNGVNGRRFTSNINGKSIFFPANGYTIFDRTRYATSYCFCWSNSYISKAYAYCVTFNSKSVNMSNDQNRYFGYGIRPVKSSN